MHRTAVYLGSGRIKSEVDFPGQHRVIGALKSLVYYLNFDFSEFMLLYSPLLTVSFRNSYFQRR